MNDPVNENGQDGTGVNWRLRSREAQEVTISADAVVLELTDSSGTALASVSIPSETLDELLRPYISTVAELQIDGTISMETEFSTALSTPPTETDLLQLVSRALAPEMLEDELDVKGQLAILRKRLTDALALVDHTLATLDKEQP